MLKNIAIITMIMTPIIAFMLLNNARANHILEHCTPNHYTQTCSFE